MEKRLSQEKIFYTYALLDPSRSGPFRYGHWVFHYEPFYIGKGKGDRKDKHQRNVRLGLDPSKGRRGKKKARIRKILKSGNNIVVRILRNNLTERAALELEVRLIHLIGRLDKHEGPLLNLTNGGDGISGFNPTAADRINLAYAGLVGGSKLKTSEHRENISRALKEKWRDPKYRDTGTKRGRKTVQLSNREKTLLRTGISKGIAVKDLVRKHRLPFAASFRFRRTLGSVA